MRFFIWMILLLVTLSVQNVDGQLLEDLKAADSLESLLRGSHLDDTTRIKVLNNLNRLFRQRDSQKSVRYAYQAIDVSKRVTNKIHLMMSYNLLGITYGMKGNLDSSMWAFEQIVPIAEKSSPMWLSNAYSNIGITYDYMSNYGASLKSLYKSLAIAEKFNFTKYGIFNSMANAYRNLNEFRMSSHYDSLAIKEADHNKMPDDIINLLMGNMAISLFKLNRLKEAKQILLKCIDYRISRNEKFYLSDHYKSIAEINVIEKRYDDAFQNFSKAQNLFEEIGNWNLVASGYGNLALVDLRRARIASAKKFALRSLVLSDSLKLLKSKQAATEMLTKIASYERDFQSASYYDSIDSILKDSINLQEQSKSAAELKIKYETERKEKENELLKLSQISHEAELSVQRYAIIMIGVILMAVLVLLFVVLRSRQLFKKTNELLKGQNHAIEIQQEEIISKKEQIALQMEELRRTQSQLIHSEKMASLGQMTSGIAHEINNPLNFISGGAEALKYSVEELANFAKKTSEDRSVQYATIDDIVFEANNLINSISNGVHRANKIITSLRTFSSPQGSAFITLNVADIIEAAVTMLNSKIIEHKIQVKKSYSKPTSFVWGSASELSQVFTNIIDNAIQAMENGIEKKELQISIESSDENVVVRVADSGHGIPKEIQNKIMEPFFTTKEVGKGTGLGLSISYGIVDKHKGKLTFLSEVGKGSEFIVALRATH